MLNVYVRIKSFFLVNLLMAMNGYLSFTFTMYLVRAGLEALFPALVAGVLYFRMPWGRYNR